MDLSRRGFLKALGAGTGTLVMGSLVVSEPRVLAGEIAPAPGLLLPKPLVLATERPPQLVTGSARAMVEKMDIEFPAPVRVASWADSHDRWDHSEPPVIRLSLILEGSTITVVPGDEVEIFIVKPRKGGR